MGEEMIIRLEKLGKDKLNREVVVDDNSSDEVICSQVCAAVRQHLGDVPAEAFFTKEGHGTIWAGQKVIGRFTAEY